MEKSDKHILFINEANKQAIKGTKNKEGGPFGCIITFNNKIIASAHNQVIKNNDCTAHAEIQAIRKACKKLKNFNLSKCELYTTTKPCPMCMGAILWSRIKKVYYTCSDKNAKKFGFDDKKFYDYFKKPNQSLLKIEYIESPECSETFSLWKKQKGKTY